MHKLIVAILLTVSALPALAQRYPNPRYSTCQVVMVDRYNRVVQRFYAYTDPRSGMCRDGLRDCNYEIRRRNVYGARCAQVRGSGW